VLNSLTLLFHWCPGWESNPLSISWFYKPVNFYRLKVDYLSNKLPRHWLQRKGSNFHIEIQSLLWLPIAPRCNMALGACFEHAFMDSESIFLPIGRSENMVPSRRFELLFKIYKILVLPIELTRHIWWKHTDSNRNLSH
jgi:hypothetical protein